MNPTYFNYLNTTNSSLDRYIQIKYLYSNVIIIISLHSIIIHNNPQTCMAKRFSLVLQLVNDLNCVENDKDKFKSIWFLKEGITIINAEYS